MEQARFIQTITEALDTATQKNNVNDLSLLVMYGRVLQASADNIITMQQTKALTDRFGEGFTSKYDDQIEIAFSGLTGPQLEELDTV
jgi:hypothetical protein